jgi:hypothetical protein
MERLFILFLYTLGTSTATESASVKIHGARIYTSMLKYNTIQSSDVNASSRLSCGNAGLARPY